MRRAPQKVVGRTLADVLLAVTTIGCNPYGWRVYQTLDSSAVVQYIALPSYVDDFDGGSFVLEVTT